MLYNKHISYTDPFGLKAGCPPLCDNLNPASDRFFMPENQNEKLGFAAAAAGVAVVGVGAVALGEAIAGSSTALAGGGGGLAMTAHGAGRAIQSGRLNVDEISDVVANAASKFTQADGASVFVQQVNTRYNVVVQNETTQRIVTNLKTIDFKALYKLATKYGWE